jgi:hypothetical protein
MSKRRAKTKQPQTGETTDDFAMMRVSDDGLPSLPIIDELRAILSEQLDELRGNKTTVKEANNVIKSVGKLLTRIRLELRSDPREAALRHVLERRKKLLKDRSDFGQTAKRTRGTGKKTGGLQ